MDIEELLEVEVSDERDSIEDSYTQTLTLLQEAVEIMEDAEKQLRIVGKDRKSKSVCSKLRRQIIDIELFIQSTE